MVYLYPSCATPNRGSSRQILAAFRDAYTNPDHDDSYMSRIMVPCIEYLTPKNALLLSWPLFYRRLLNLSSPSELIEGVRRHEDPSAATGHDDEGHSATQPDFKSIARWYLATPDRHVTPFETWAQPRHLERRKQAIAVWYNLLHFLVFNWHGYGGDNALESMGLHLDRKLFNILNDIKLYSSLTWSSAYDGSTRCSHKNAMTENIEEFFHVCLFDPNATPRTNLILWWVAVLIHSDVQMRHPRLPISGMVDQIDMTAKLHAINHYARVLVAEWSMRAFLNGPSLDTKIDEVLN